MGLEAVVGDFLFIGVVVLFVVVFSMLCFLVVLESLLLLFRLKLKEYLRGFLPDVPSLLLVLLLLLLLLLSLLLLLLLLMLFLLMMLLLMLSLLLLLRAVAEKGYCRINM